MLARRSENVPHGVVVVIHVGIGDILLAYDRRPLVPLMTILAELLKIKMLKHLNKRNGSGFWVKSVLRVAIDVD